MILRGHFWDNLSFIIFVWIDEPHVICVFAEWFRFPSLCICKCYNKPENWWEDLLPDPSENSETDEESELDEVEEVLEEIEGEQVLEALPEALPLTADTSDIPATSRAKKKLGRKWTPGIITRALSLVKKQIKLTGH